MAIVEFTVQFDKHVWESMNYSERQRWIDEVRDSINDIAYVSNINAKED